MSLSRTEWISVGGVVGTALIVAIGFVSMFLVLAGEIYAQESETRSEIRSEISDLRSELRDLGTRISDVERE